MDADRIRLAENFLREAVFASRGAQAAIGSLRAPRPSGTGSCGLGEEASIVLELAPRARDLYEHLFSPPHQAPRAERIRSVTSEWIERQDTIDRKRNHFLKDFRGRHGLDRTSYAPDVLADYEDGLARINAEEDVELRSFGERLIAPES